jgi:antitoxin component YwqK of YwqJK toxin-antitoxin module
MNKNIISVFLISFLIISCSNNEKQSINKNKKTVVVTNDKSDLPTIKKVENIDKILVRESTELNSVSADQLKVDGGQRYFLNDVLYSGFTCQYDGEQILFEIKFKNGRKDGVSKFWHNNGSPKSMLTFKNGIAKGAYKLWDKSGKLIEQGTN